MQHRRTADVVIVGGGLHGCSAALHLCLRGLSVIIFEKDHVGRHASGVNAGGVRRLGRDLAEVPLAQASAQYWREIAALVDDDCGYRESRYLKVAQSDEELVSARSRVEKLRKQGFTHEGLIDRETVREFLPAAADCVGALHVAGDGYAHPFRTIQAFRRRAAKLGARFFEGTTVLSARRKAGVWHLKTSQGMFSGPYIVNAAGAWGGQFADRLGDPVPLEAHAPMLAITARMPVFVSAVVGALGEALSLKQFGNGTVLIGGGVRGRAIPHANRTVLDMAGVSKFLRTARRVFPLLKDADIVRTWAGIEGYTPDNLPVIDRGRADGVVHAFGFSAHGFQLAPAVGKIVAELITDVQPIIPVDLFSATRFDSYIKE